MKKLFGCLGLITLSLLLMVGVASANLIQYGGFESPVVSDSKYSSWAVYNSIGSWSRLAGQGIEIQTSGTVVDAHGGDQYVELDSDSSHHVSGYTYPGAPTNSAMGQAIYLTAGTYELSFWYRPRTDDANDNGIAYGLWGGNVASLTMGEADGKSSDITDWMQVTHSFDILSEGTYTIAFAAVGDSNKTGGFIDDVELNAVPIPGAVWLLGSGLLGLVGIRRKKA